jgi:hypothetical protein
LDPFLLVTNAQTAQQTCAAANGRLTDNGNGTFTCTPPGGAEGALILNAGGNVTGSSATPYDPNDTGCHWYDPGNWVQKCFWEPVASTIGALFLTAGAAALRGAGALFDVLVQYVIIGFGTFIRGGLEDAINSGWTIFRDIANIAIIGMFIFIAISIILGLKAFGQKKLIANVIIVAILLNFSLLFTKLVIDFSNLAATQFYNAAAKVDQNDKTTIVGAGGTQSTQWDIASAFLRPMGITSIWDTQNLTAAIANNTHSGWQPLIYGLVGGLMLAWIAFVLMYGSFLIALRGILFIVLLVTSAIAFASYLIPTFAEGRYGFKAWWKALLNAALFAPILMIFLFISFTLVQTLGTSHLSEFISQSSGDAGQQTIDTSATQPLADPTAWGSIFNFIIISGLLFASFKISHKIASNIPGSDLPLRLGRAAVAAGTAAVTGSPAAGWSVLQSMGGRSGYQRANDLQGKAQAASARAGLARKEYTRVQQQLKDTTLAPEVRGNLQDQAQKFEREMGKEERSSIKFAAQSNTIASRAPVKKFTERVIDRAKKAATIANRATVPAKEIQKMAQTSAEKDPRIEALKEAQEQAVRAARIAEEKVTVAREQERTAQEKKTTTEKVRNEVVLTETKKVTGDAEYTRNHQEIDEGSKGAVKITDDIKEAFISQLGNLREDLRGGIQAKVEGISHETSPDAINSIRNEIISAAEDGKRPAVQNNLQAAGQKESDLRHEQDRISRARDAIVRKAQGDDTINKIESVQRAEAEYKESQSVLRTATNDLASMTREQTLSAREAAAAKKKVDDELRKVTDEAAKEIRSSVRESHEEIAASIARRGFGVIPDFFSSERNAAADAAKSRVREDRSRQRQMRDTLQRLASRNDEAAPGGAAKST